MVHCNYFEIAKPCSGNGICNSSSGLCECNPGWTSWGDFAIEPGLDCDIHIATLKSLGYINAIFSLMVNNLQISGSSFSPFSNNTLSPKN